MPPSKFSAGRLAAITFLGAAALGLGLPACTVDATGALVTLELNGLTPHTVSVNVRRANTTIGTRSYTTADPIPDGATFGVQLPDALDGVKIDIDVAVFDEKKNFLGGGSAHLIAARHTVLRVSVPIGAVVTDAAVADGSDAGPIDGPPSDLTRADGPPPDLASTDTGLDAGVDGGNGDAGVVDGGADMCIRSCTNGMAVTCGSPAVVACTCDAKGLGCALPTCQAPTDVSAGGTFTSDTTNGMDLLSGSCGGKGGPEAVFSLTLNKFATVTLGVNAAISPVFYTRQTCGPGPELVANGPCNQMPEAQACSVAMNNPKQVLCGLPPGTYFPIVDGSGKGFPFSLTVSMSPVSLDDCPGAGMLPGAKSTISGDTTGKNGSHMQAPANKMGCGIDQGANAPEFVFYVPAPNSLPNGHLIAKLSNVSNGFVPLLYIEQLCSSMTTVCALGTQQNAYSPSIDITPVMQGPYFIIVDGDQGTRGSFTLDVTWQ